MFIKAKYNGNDVLLNTDYIVDIWFYNEEVTKAFVVGNDETAYEIEKKEFNKLSCSENPNNIVKCKDCKHFAHKWCYEMAKATDDDDFCSYGERRK